MNKKDIKILEETYDKINNGEVLEEAETLQGIEGESGQPYSPDHTPEEREDFIRKALAKRDRKNSFKVVGEVKLKFVNPEGKVEAGFDEVVDLTGTSSWEIYNKIKQILNIED